MHSQDNGAASVFQTVNNMHVPQRSAAVEQPTENASGQRLQLSFSARRGEPYMEYVPPDVELRIIFPRGKTKAQRGNYGDLPVARNQMQLGVYACDELLKWYWAIENAHACNMQGNLFAFEIEKCGVHGGQSTTEHRLFHVRVSQNLWERSLC